MIRRTFAVVGLAAAISAGSLSVGAISTETTQAASSDTFLIPANDGYGIADCVSSGSSCGQVVADAWCEAQGFARSASFRQADLDQTGSVPTGAARPISVTCAN